MRLSLPSRRVLHRVSRHAGTRLRWVALALAVGAAPLAAQAPAPGPEPGAMLRVWSSVDSRYGRLTVRGTLRAWETEAIVLMEEATRRERHIPWATVTRVDVSRGVVPRLDGIRWGARRGAFVGLAAAPLLAFYRWHRGDSPVTIARTLVTSALVTGGAGAAVGGFFGTTLRHTRWERLPLGLPDSEIIIVAP